MTLGLLVALQALSFNSSRSQPVGAASVELRQAPADWTVMIYLNADNNLEVSGVQNFRDMAHVGSTDRVNILVQFDRLGRRGLTSPDWSQTLRFRVRAGMEPIPVNALEDLGEMDMGDTATIHDFVLWAKRKYPAKHYFLIVWDHGQGWRAMVAANLMTSNATRDRAMARWGSLSDTIMRTRDHSIWHVAFDSALEARSTRLGIAAFDPSEAAFALYPDLGVVLPQGPGQSPFRSISQDDTNGGHTLYNRGIQIALRNEGLDVIGFDACLMSMVETAYAMRGVAKVMVGSEELEPGSGWPYDLWLDSLVRNPALDPPGLARAIVRSFSTVYSPMTRAEPYTTLAAVDLTKIDTVTSTVDTFANALMQDLGVEVKPVKAARAHCPDFASWYSNQFHGVDLGCFAGGIAAGAVTSELQQKAKRVQIAVERAVIANYASPKSQSEYQPHGLAIYFPASATAYKSDPFAQGGYERANVVWPVEFVQDNSWTLFLHEYISVVP